MIFSDLQTIRDWIRYGATQFEKAELFYGHGTDNAWDEALALVLHALKLDYELGEKILDCRLTEDEKKAIFSLYEIRILKHLPVPYITQKAYYGGFCFHVDERVLIPRSPILELIEKRLEPWVAPEKVRYMLDIGTGSACLSIIMAHYFPESQIDAVDIDKSVLEVARNNVTAYDLQNRIELIESDLFSALAGKTYDVIITNPPYVDADEMARLPKEYRHEPVHALASGEDGLSHIRQILSKAKHFLNPNGILIGEVGHSEAALCVAYPQINFTWLEFQRGGEGIFLLDYEQLQQIS